jgi:molecular chaperone GrpE
MPNSHGNDGEQRPWPAAAPSGPATEQADRAEDGGDLTAELARIEDRYKRALADLDNYRKRSARELERRVSEASESLLREWLDAVDSVERAVRIGPSDPCYDGMRAVLEQMDAILARHGVQRIGAPGEPFDPSRHEAIGVELTSEVPSHTIKSVERSGFALGDRVIRPAQVVVARAPEPAS